MDDVHFLDVLQDLEDLCCKEANLGFSECFALFEDVTKRLNDEMITPLAQSSRMI